jgi:hypothetical protein
VRGVAAVAALALAALTGGSARAEAPAPLSVHGVLTPAAIHFADSLVAEIEVAYDPSQVDGASIRVVPGFGPFQPTSPPTVSHGHRGDLVVLRYRYALQCLTDGCLPLTRAREMRLPRLTVTGSADGQPVRASAAWPGLRVLSRVPERAANGPLVFRHQSELPPPDYAVSPGALASGLIALAVLAAGGGAWLLARALRRRTARSAADRLTPLERALRYVRDAATRADPADRRRALELLAEVVDAEGRRERLAGEVHDAAWVETAPTPQRSTELADAVEAGDPR